MRTPAKIASPSTGPALGLHCRTWAWLAAVASLLVLVEVPGAHGQPSWRFNLIEHGWPLTYAVRDCGDLFKANLWAVGSQVVEFSCLALAGDVLMCALILAAVGYWREQTLRANAGKQSWYQKLPWRLLLDAALACSIAAGWFFEQRRLASGNPFSAFELRPSSWSRDSLGDEFWLTIPLLAGCLVVFTMHALRKRGLAALPLAVLLTPATLAWTAARSQNIYGGAASMLVDAIGAMLLALLISGMLRRWRARDRSPAPRQKWKWQFGLRGLLIFSALAGLCSAAAVESLRFLDALNLDTAGDYYRPICPPFLRPLARLAERLGVIDPFVEYYPYDPPGDDRDLARLRYLAESFPDSFALSVTWDPKWSDEIELKRLPELRRTRNLQVYARTRHALDALQGLDQLQWLSVSLAERHDADVEAAVDRLIEPARTSRLRGAFLLGKPFDDQQLERLAKASRLEQLCLTCGPCYVDHLPPTFASPRYDGRAPNRGRGRASDEGLRALAGLEHLEVLCLAGTQIRGPGLVHLRSLPHLRHLAIENAPLDDAGLASINGCHKLISLCLAHTDIRSLRSLDFEQLAHLRSLDVSHTNLDPKELRRLRLAHPQLRIRHAFFDELDEVFERKGIWSQPTREQLPLISRLHGITNLRLSGTDVSDSDLARLQELTHLTYLYLDRTSISEAGLAHLNCVARLEHVFLDDTDVARLTHLRDALQLRQLWLSRSKVDDSACSDIAAMTSLEELCIDGTRVTNAGLATLRYHPTLQSILLDASLVDATLIATLQSMPSLQEVILRDPTGQNTESAAAMLRAKLTGVQVWAW